MIILRNSELFASGPSFKSLPQYTGVKLIERENGELVRRPSLDPGCIHGYQKCHLVECEPGYIPSGGAFIDALVAVCKLDEIKFYTEHVSSHSDRDRNGRCYTIPGGDFRAAFGYESIRITSRLRGSSIIEANHGADQYKLLEFVKECLAQEVLECLHPVLGFGSQIRSAGRQRFNPDYFGLLDDSERLNKLKATSGFVYPPRNTKELLTRTLSHLYRTHNP